MSETERQLSVNLESNSVSPSLHANQSKNTQHVYWCFTMYDYNERLELIKEYLVKNTKSAVFGYEICPTTGREHLQGFFELKARKRLTSIQNKPITWSYLAPAYSDEYACNKYCTKDGNVWNHPPKRATVRLISNLRPYQVWIENKIKEEPDDRAIHWFFDYKGGKGKSSLCKYLIERHDALYISDGKKSDILNIVYNYVLTKDLNCVLLDVPRSHTTISYKSLEEIKNGIICNTKYETGTKVINPPHIFVFANMLPDRSQFSEDRWNVYEIENDFNLTKLD